MQQPKCPAPYTPRQSASKYIMSHIELMAGGEFRILNGGSFARNLPGGGQQGPQMTEITVTVFSGIYSTWVITPAGSENAFIITNAGSSNKAYVSAEDKDTPVYCYSEGSTEFAIERAGSGEYVIKAVNEDLLWTVGPDGNVILAPADGTPAQRFRFERAINADSD